MPENASKDHLRQCFDQEISHPDFQQRYHALQQAHSPLQDFPTASSLLEFLWDSENKDYPKKDSCLHALIAAVQTREDLKSAAVRLLLRAMWPALDHLHHVFCSLLPNVPDLFTEVYWHFLEEVREWDLAKTTKVASNLRWNTRKRLWRVIRNAHEEIPLLDDIIEGDDDKPRWAVVLDHKNQLYKHRKPRPHVLQTDAELARDLARTIHSLLDEGVLKKEEHLYIIHHAVYGVPLQDLALRLNLPYKTLCKRYERVAAKVRLHFDL
ncbi:MAG: hypothetical protein HY548_07060 [Elusimicrobia bacterium]|nr:hypothetical protein [Elusimicrobiota bacterium]